jgi:hypothetical protein
LERIQNTKEVQKNAKQRRWPHRDDLGVATDDYGIGMVARMTPTPRHRIANHAE